MTSITLNSSENPYESPDSVSEKKYVRSGLPRMLAALTTAGLLGVVIPTRIAFRAIFEDFGFELPFVSVLAVSSWAIVIPVTLLMVIAVKEFVLSNDKCKQTLDVIACLLAVLLGLGYTLGVLMPMVVLMDSLSR